MAVEKICGQPRSDCETIDRTPDDDALLNARKAFPNAKLHRSTLNAVQKLLPCLGGLSQPQKRGMILGHGMPGLIITGTGQVKSDIDKRIEDANFSNWQPHLVLLDSKITELTFCSCETGAGTAGATLLAKVANVIKAKASAFTGLIFIDSSGNITCETGGEWQSAEPDITPTPIPAPEYPIEEDHMVTLKLKYQGQYIDVPIAAVSAVKYFPKLEHKPPFSLEGPEAQKLVATINFADPKELKSAPLAVLTANLEVEVKLEDQGARVWRFTVFNNRLLQDESAPDTFYFASPDFIKRVSERS